MPTAILRLRRFVFIAALVSQLWVVASPTHSQAPSPQRIESDDPVVQQTGAWISQTSGQASGGTYLYSSGSPDDVLTLEFEGTAIEILYVAGPSLGTLAVEVDGTVLRTVITTADSTAYQQSTRLDYLTDEPHTLRVYAQEGGIIGVDAFTLPAPTPLVTVNEQAEGGSHASVCAPSNSIHLVSRTALGLPASYNAENPSLSADGRYVAFETYASLIAGDGDNSTDIYVYDRQTCSIELISVSSTGEKADNTANTPSISDDARYVAFASYATNLVTGDTNLRADIFVRDRQTGATIRASVSSAGVQGNESSFSPSISADGRLVTFQSDSTNLIATDTNGVGDVFVHNLNNGNTTRVSIATGGTQATGGNSYAPTISSTGRYVVFASQATNLVGGDTNGQGDVFVRDRQSNTTIRVSVATGGTQATGGTSRDPAISTDGRYVVFESDATDLVTGDTNGFYDVFLHDTTTTTTTRLSVGTGGTQSDEDSGDPVISGDSRYVVYESDATNLVAGDTNTDTDIFLFDQTLGTTIRLSVSDNGVEGDGDSEDAALSRDGRYAGFDSTSTNLVEDATSLATKVMVTPVVQNSDDTLALFNPLYNQVNLIDTLADTPPYTAYTAFSAYAPVSDGTWVMGDWNADGLDTPGVYLDYVFYYTNTSGESAPSDWGGFWVGVNGPPVAGRFSNAVNDCIGAVDSAPSGGMTIFALYFTCDFSGVNPAPLLTFQWLSAPLPDPTFTGTFQFMAGDFNGDGLDSIAVRRNEYIAFGNVNPAAGPAIFDLAQYIGAPGTGDNGSFVVGDWDGNGLDSFGLFYQNGELFYRNDLDFNTGVYLNQSVGTPFGNSGVQVATWH